MHRHCRTAVSTQYCYLWRTTAVLGHSKSIRLTVKWHLQWSQTGWLSLDRRCEWVIRLWPILSRVMTVSSRRHNDVRGLFLPNVLAWLKTVYLSRCYPMNLGIRPYTCIAWIYAERSSLGILLWVMTEKIPSLDALSAISFPFIPTWLGIQHRLTCLPISVSWV